MTQEATPTLHHTPITGDQRPAEWLFVLHGIFGAGRNWASVARRLVREIPALGALTVDLRGHGGSPTMEPPHTLAACAHDVADLARSGPYGSPSVLGHSFGGKVALLFAAQAPTPPPQIWVMDSTPDARPPSGSAWRMLRVLNARPGPFADRGEAIRAVEAEGYDNSVAQWMATNTIEGDDGLVWRLDARQMEALLRSFFDTDAWDIVEQPPDGTVIHLVKATESSILSPEAIERIEAAGRATGRVHLHHVEGGHWLNADNPKALHELLLRGLSRDA